MTNTPEVQAKVGDLATMSINGDSYVVIIYKVTPKTITVHSVVKQSDGSYKSVPDPDLRTFRWSEKRQGYIYAQYFRLTLGKAVERRDPSF